MQYLLNPYTDNLPNYSYWENAFDNNELDFLQQQAKNSTQPGLVGGINDPNEIINMRRSTVNWISYDSNLKWLYEKLSHIVSSLNVRFHRLDLTGFGESIQLTNYDQSDNGMYSWHQDSSNNGKISRKLSIVLQLTDPSQYEGGNLQIMVENQPVTIRKQRGLLVAFPSFSIHQVTPVTQGSRQSLVAWISGPQFK